MLKKRKIAYVLSYFPAFTQTFILREITELKRRGLDIYIFSLRNRNKQNNVEFYEDTFYSSYILSLKVIKANLYGLFLNPLKYLWLIIYILRHNIRNPKVMCKILGIFPKTIYFTKIIKDKNIKHIHAHWATIPTVSALIISEILNIPFSFTAHAWDIYVDQTMLEEKIKKSSFVLTCTHHNKKFLENFCPDPSKGKIYLSYHGLDLRRYTPKKNIPEENIIVSGGSLEEKKGLDYLIMACKILRERNLNFQCIIVGQGSEETKLRDMISKLSMQEYITLSGPIQHDKVIDILTSANVYVLPCIISRNNDMDGIPNMLIEAMAVGTPVVSTNISGIPELVTDKENGMLVQQKNHLMLADAIQAILINPDLQRVMGSKAREKVQKRFNIENNVDEMIQIFFT